MDADKQNPSENTFNPCTVSYRTKEMLPCDESIINTNTFTPGDYDLLAVMT